MKKTIIWVIVGIIVIIGIIFIVKSQSGTPSTTGTTGGTTGGMTASPSPVASTVSVPAVETTSAGNGLSKYSNEELGFSVSYPTAWKLDQSPSGPVFTIPTTGKNTIAALSASVVVTGGKCMAPPVVASSIKEQNTMTQGALSFKMYSIVNTTNTLKYQDRFYSLQQGTGAAQICYSFTFGSVTVTPVSKNISQADTPAVTTNNAAQIKIADEAFTTMVKSFGVVTTAAGESETQHANGK